MKILTNLIPLIERYDLFIIDIWGIIHDGKKLYPNILQSLEKIQKFEKKIVFLSNAPRRSFKTAEVLEDFGIGKDKYDLVYTSGETAFEYFIRLSHEGITKKYYYIGPEKDRDVLHGTSHIRVQDPSVADIAIATGLEPDETITDISNAIKATYEAGLELFCINPDKIVIRQDGTKQICAGAIADEYHDLGGEVTYFGKPYPTVYESIMKRFSVEAKRVLCIGDTIHTDIAGANMMGYDSLFITSGTHVEDLQTKVGQLPDEKKLQAFLKKAEVKPDYIAALFEI